MTTRSARGFTLAEVAIVLVVVSLLLGGMLMPLGSQQELRNRREAAKALASITESLIGFALINGRLPCPAEPTLAAGTGGICPGGGSALVAGCEATTGAGAALACSSLHGVLPWATLGLPEADAWGNRYSYRVAAHFARGIDPGQKDFGADCALNPPDHSSYDAALSDGPRQAAFALCTRGDIAVLDAAGGTSLVSDLPAIVVSHGRNGGGAWTTQGVRLAASDVEEAENADDDADFVAGMALDDQVQWIPRSLLMNRMLVAGKLP